MKDLDKLKYTESKDLLISVLNGISNTRNKTWQIIGILLTIQAFLITDFFDCEFTSVKSMIFIISVPFSLLIYYKCFNSVFPDDLALNGMKPNQFYDDTDYLELADYYDRCMEENSDVLNDMALNYKQSVQLGLLFVLVVIVLFLVMFVKSQFF